MSLAKKLVLGMMGGRGAGYYKKLITITGSSGGAQTDYPVRVDVVYDSKMKSDFSDLQFKSGNDNLDFWIESSIPNTSAIVWVKIPSIPASPETAQIYMFYGNKSYSSLGSGINVFSLFDDFTGLPETSLHATNAASPTIDTNLYMAENIVFDTVTNKYWWIMEDRNANPTNLILAYTDTLSGTWTVQPTPVLSDSVNLGSPCLVKFGSFWYIYYQRNDVGSGILSDIYCAKSSTVNSGYSTAGISNPVIARGGAGTWEERRVLEPYVFQEGTTYYMFYMGEDTPGLIETTGYATASNPIGPWTKYNLNPVLTGTGAGIWDNGQDKAADPFVFKVGNIFYVGVTASQSGKSGWQIGFFQTTDFITFTECVGNPVLKYGGAGAFDFSSAFRGAVYVENGIYYFPYIGVNGTIFKPGLTTLTFAENRIIDTGKWTVIGSLGYLVDGIVTTVGASTAYIVSILKFGQNYSFRTLSKLDTTLNSVIGFRNGVEVGYLEILANYPTINNVNAYQYLTTDASSADLDNPGEWKVYEISRNANTSGIYSINDVVKASLSTQVPSSDFSILVKGSALSDWVMVRKYINPEPSVSIGTEESGIY